MIAGQWIRLSVDRVRGVLRPRRRLLALRARLTAARTRRAFRVLLRRGIGLPEVAEGAVPVIMCMWTRPDRLMPSLEMLAAQAGATGLHLFIWNNDADRHAEYAASLSESALSGALLAAHLHSSRTNIGGVARFIVARELLRAGYRGPVILLDDDQQVAPDFVARLLAAWSPRTYAGVWAWRVHGDYWDRTEALDGQDATYVGTGGAVIDAELVGSEELLRELPLRRLFLEDMWLSAFALRRGWRLRGVDAGYRFTDLPGNQWHAIADSKSMFFDELGRPGLIPR